MAEQNEAQEDNMTIAKKEYEAMKKEDQKETFNRKAEVSKEVEKEPQALSNGEESPGSSKRPENQTTH